MDIVILDYLKSLLKAIHYIYRLAPFEHPLTQLLEQPAEQLRHVPRQVSLHVAVHASIWQPVAEDRVALLTRGTLARTTAPRIGNAPKAALRKNWRRDCSSSFFLF